MMNIADAMMLAAVVISAVKKVRIVRGSEAQRVRMESGVRRMEGTVRQAPAKKRANIQWDAMRTRVRASMMLEGRATGDRIRTFQPMEP